MTGPLSSDYATFRDPQSLHDALLNMSNPETTDLDPIIHVRAVILSPLEHQNLTEMELNGGIDGVDCPQLERLTQDWRRAFRQLPRQHSVKAVQFDMDTTHEMGLRHMTRLLQAVSTVVALKAAPQRVHFCVSGCSDKQKAFLERNMFQ